MPGAVQFHLVNNYCVPETTLNTLHTISSNSHNKPTIPFHRGIKLRAEAICSRSDSRGVEELECNHKSQCHPPQPADLHLWTTNIQMVSRESGISLLWYFSKSPKNLFSQNASSLVLPPPHTGIFRQQNF